MIFHPTPLAGAFVIELEPRGDARGSFARTYCAREFAEHGISMNVAQCNLSVNRVKGTLRGMHFQVAPHAEAKLVRCAQGAMWDVIVDLRPGSPTCRQWFGETLSADNNRMMMIPEGFAHGFITLTDDVSVFYQMGAFYHPEAQSGMRWDDTAIGIQWPAQPVVIADKDLAWPLLQP